MRMVVVLDQPEDWALAALGPVAELAGEHELVVCLGAALPLGTLSDRLGLRLAEQAAGSGVPVEVVTVLAHVTTADGRPRVVQRSALHALVESGAVVVCRLVAAGPPVAARDAAVALAEELEAELLELSGAPGEGQGRDQDLFSAGRDFRPGTVDGHASKHGGNGQGIRPIAR